MTSLLAILGVVILNTANTTLAIKADKGEPLQISYYGVSADENEILSAGYAPNQAYPAYGLARQAFNAISATDSKGNKTLGLKVLEVSRENWSGGEILRIVSEDGGFPIRVVNCFKTYRDEDFVQTWAEIANPGKKELVLTRFDSGCLPLRGGNVWVSSLYGAPFAETRLNEEPVSRSGWSIRSTDGVRNSHCAHSEIMLSLDGKPDGKTGAAVGAALCWGGNFEMRINHLSKDYIALFAGICPENSEYHLQAGKTFATPHLVYTWSCQGTGGVSRNFHRWARKYALHAGDKPRKILLNSWEGVWFDINEAGMEQMMSDISDMGGELFVMDDGWFGGKYPRNNARSSLGDWVVNKAKLPSGIGHLVQTASSKGISFGIWLEPEMLNTESELYEKHPDWVIGQGPEDGRYGRGGTQLLLDLSNPEVRDFIFDTIDRTMKENPGIDYIKWDANTAGYQMVSRRLTHQSHINVEYWRGLETVFERVREKYPDLTMQACASGGGRVNYGVLPWFDEFWTSDNTDAYQRLFIQWGCSYFFPAIAMGAHVSATPSREIGRNIHIKYRCDVAFSGRFGLELQPAKMTGEEKSFCREVISNYKQVREVIQFGDLYRLQSPYGDKGFSSLMYVNEDKSKAVFFWWRLSPTYDQTLPRSLFDGLDPGKKYIIRELNRIDNSQLVFEGKVFSGRFLMESGLDMPAKHDLDKDKRTDWSSRVLYLESQ